MTEPATSALQMAALAPLDVAPRLSRVRQRLGEQADALLVSDLSNLRWLTGFTGSNGWAVVAPTELILVTDGRYGVQAAAQMAELGVDGRVLVGGTSAELLEHLVASTANFSTLAVEADHVSHSQFLQYQESMKAQLVSTSGVVEAERRTKDAGEVARIAEACRIA
ncbi:MAG: aminopeptidase P family N-terminal domain-containing protein, partial [Ilumatobacteraceae bacterium]